MTVKKRILVVDDHPIVRSSIVAFLSKTYNREDIAEASNCREAVTLAASGSFNIAIVDLELPDANGTDILHRIYATFPSIRLIVYTMHEEPWLIRELMNAKAAAIVLKGEDTMELLTAVESVTAGMPYFSQRFLALADERYDLSERALEVISLIALGLSSREIAQRIFISENTVEYHRKLILKRLGAKNNAHAVSIAINLGLIDGNIQKQPDSGNGSCK
ncbi:MAG: response regulator transcription factor [Bacteroidales bacterium]|nr:response regulator transcription factor [Bacteroidales bacterium]MCM1147784.1 response regulator transcription factor [Bacteroidales bacterium]MCM1206606.1 response regulator transcription factor [Bacillota bacterium]MCM1510653.1 response regulator transcription factor [Clostridium sp.]